MANKETSSATSSVGRFSSQLLGQFGAQKSVKQENGVAANTYKYAKGNEAFPSPGSIALSAGNYESGSLHANTYTAVHAYFESRGASSANAAAMASIIIDTAKISNVSPMSLLDYSSKTTNLSDTAYFYINNLRTLSDQQSKVSDVNNRKSLKSRSIRA